MDALAHGVGKDPAEIRRINYIAPFDQPHAIAAGLQLDSGNFAGALDRALEMVGYESLRAEQRKRRESGGRSSSASASRRTSRCAASRRRRCSPRCNYVAGGWDAAVVRCHPTGKVTVVTGTSPHGQGHVTTWSQIIADKLGVPFEDVDVLHGDTAISPLGHGHVRKPQPLGRRRRALVRDREGAGEGAADRGARAGGAPTRISSGPTARSA